jgi:O-antigen ligase
MAAALAVPDAAEQSITPVKARPPRPDVLPYGIASLLLSAPLAFGAVEPWAIFVLESAATAFFVLWVVKQVRSGQITAAWNPIFLPMCAFAALIVSQWLSTSAYRHATYSELLLYTAYGIVCFLISQTLTRTTHVRNLATAFAVYGSCVAMFAVLQSLSAGGKLYWVRTPRFGGWIYGPYVNHNHYAGLMEMLVPIPLVFTFTRYARGRKRWLAAAAAAFMGATIFLCGSRGGMAAFAFQMALFIWLLLRERTHNRVPLLMGAFLLIALASVAFIGGSEVSARLATLGWPKHADLSVDLRYKINSDGLRMFSNRPILGWGLGTFSTVYPLFRSFYTDAFVNAAHNDYLQVLTETGAVGFAIAIWFLVAAIRPAVRKIRNWPSDVNGAVALAALVGMSGILVHSFVDFNLQIPANALLFYVLCTVAAMEPRFRNHMRERHKHSAVEETVAQ